jgi:hypothetical protein
MYVIVEILCHTHGALGSERQLLGRFLLKRGGGERRRRILAALATLHLGDAERLAALEVAQDTRRFRFVVNLGFLAVDLVQLGREALTGLLEERLHRPVLHGLERADLPLALHDEPQGDGLHATGRDALLHRLPEHRTGLVPNQTVQNPSGLLGLDLLVINFPGLLDGEVHRVLGDLVEEHAPHGDAGLAALGPDLLRHVPRDGLSFAIGVGGDEHFTRILRRALELGDRLLLAGNRHELGLEAMLDVDAELLLREVHDVADGGAHPIAAAEILADRLRLGRRLDDHQGCAASRGRRVLLLHGGRLPAAGGGLLGGALACSGLFRGRSCRGLLGCHVSQCTVWVSAAAPGSSNPDPSIMERRSSSAMRPSNCIIARSITCSSSAGSSAPAPVSASRCPHASGAKRPRSCGPRTRIVMSPRDAGGAS